MEYSLLQPRSAPEGAPAGFTPGWRGSPLRPLYTPMLCFVKAATAAVDCETISTSLTWAPSIFGAAHFGRWVVTHSLAGSNLHGHRPAIHSRRHPLWDLCMSQHSGSVSPLSEHPASPALLTNFGPHRHARSIGIRGQTTPDRPCGKSPVIAILPISLGRRRPTDPRSSEETEGVQATLVWPSGRVSTTPSARGQRGGLCKALLEHAQNPLRTRRAGLRHSVK